MVKTIVVTRLFGTTPAMDSYTIAILVPNVLGSLVASTVAAGLVPALAKAECHGPESRATVFRTSFLIVVAVCLLGTMIIATFPGAVIRLLVFSLDPARAAAARSMLPLASLLFVLNSIYAFGSAELLSRKRFLIVGAAPAISTCLSLAIIWTFGNSGISVLVWSLVIGTAVQAAVVAGPAWNASRGGSLFSWHAGGVRDVLIAQISLLGVASVGVANVFVDQAVATWLPAGNVSALNYASTLNGAVMQVVVMTLGWVALPELSALAAAGDLKVLQRRMRTCIVLATMIAAPVCAMVLCFGQVGIRIIFQHGQFHAQSTQLVYVAWAGYSIGLVPVAIAMMAARLANALQANALLFRTGLILLGLNAALDIVFMRTIGLFGISLSTSIVYCVAGFLLYRGLRPRIGRIVDRQTSRLIGAAALGSAAALLPVWVLREVLPGNTGVAIMLVAFFCVLVTVIYLGSHLLSIDNSGRNRFALRLRIMVEDRF
jgi:putative peptidoglycan lipid II flippase